MEKSKIGTVEAIMLILTVVVTHCILSLPNNILTKYKSASVLNVIYVGLIAIILSLLIFKLFKKFPGMDILDISEVVAGKIFKNILGIIFISYFIITSSFMLRNFCESIKIIYYPMTNITFLIGFFVIAVCIANGLGFNATLKTNRIILPFALVSIVFLFLTNINNFQPQRIFPILGDGFVNTFILGTTNLASFGGIVYLYFLPPLLKEPDKFKKIAVTSTFATVIYLIFTVATLLFMFSFFLSINEISPLYNATRYIEFGTFFQRLESVFLLIWILAFACYLSITFKMSTHIFQKVTSLSNSKPLIPILGLLVFVLALLPENLAVSQFFEDKLYKFFVIFIVFILGIGILAFANIFNKSINSCKK